VYQITISTVSEFVEYVDKLPLLGNLWFRGVPKTKQLPVPGIIWQKATEEEGALEHDFLISYKSYVDGYNFEPWELYALMQHHGLPTRLLDWSESPLVALYFALTSEPKSKTFRAVWVLNPYELNKKTLGEDTLYCPAIIEANEFDVGGKLFNLNAYLPPNLAPEGIDVLPDFPMAINATQHIKRVSAQKGCFTVHGENINGIHEYLDDSDYFHMIRIDARSNEIRQKMIKTLACLGIDEEFIYQDLDSLCRRIKRVRLNK
jgi:hypothetical protein